MTISSMTAFACIHGNDPGPPSHDWTWEVRSVNARGLDVRLRLPAGFEGLEFTVRGMVGRCCKRGAVSLVLTVIRIDERNMVHVNEDLLTRWIMIASEWHRRYPELIRPPRLDGLLALPGVLAPPAEDGNKERTKTCETLVLQTLDQALAALMTTRAEEGERLAARLVTHLDLLAARADVREELDRLHAHVLAARQILAEGGVVGRRLDFLCQEFNREANTLCAKSGSVDLTRIGLDLKATVDQLREQVQNIE
ncbi:MAG: hypothetical protein FD153_2078 [Rhodospirillaceae bacterium]|nr:MAG: hypothetical protein FD153_2078 [Rhodospirillaceae bacterium]